MKWSDLHTFYVQHLCNRVFANSKKTVKENDWRNQANQLLKEQEILFYSIRQLLTNNQWKLLTAIAKEDYVNHPTSKDFMKKYALSGSATVVKNLNLLLDKGFIFKDYDENRDLDYAAYDLYLRRWCQRK